MQLIYRMYVCPLSCPTIFDFLSQLAYMSHVLYTREVIKNILSYTFYKKNKLNALTLVLHFANYFS